VCNVKLIVVLYKGGNMDETMFVEFLGLLSPDEIVWSQWYESFDDTVVRFAIIHGKLVEYRCYDLGNATYKVHGNEANSTR
jgi:hypothetical protein